MFIHLSTYAHSLTYLFLWCWEQGIVQARQVLLATSTDLRSCLLIQIRSSGNPAKIWLWQILDFGHISEWSIQRARDKSAVTKEEATIQKTTHSDCGSQWEPGGFAVEKLRCLSVNLVSLKLTMRSWHSPRRLHLRRENSQNQNKAKINMVFWDTFLFIC